MVDENADELAMVGLRDPTDDLVDVWLRGLYPVSRVTAMGQLRLALERQAYTLRRGRNSSFLGPSSRFVTMDSPRPYPNLYMYL